MESHFSEFLCAYRKGVSSQHALIRLIEDWKTDLEQDKHITAILMDLSKPVDCLPKNLLIAKLHAYGVGSTSLRLIKSYLTDRKQSVKLNGYLSTWGSLNQGMPQGSYLGLLFFNVFVNDIFLIISSRSLCNFADDNRIAVSASNIKELNELVKINTIKCIEWFNHNHITANKSKFQSLVVSK